jgi:hypothetical protein
MPAAFARVVVENGIRTLSCPICASPLVTEEDGAVDQPCAHVLFVVDWIGELHVNSQADGASEERLETLRGDSESLDQFLAAASAELPASVLLLRIEEPGRGAGHDGSTFSAAFDFASL